MGTDKPRIAILMAVYEPRMDWLREQLLSLNAQTYPNLMLYVRDDCSPTVPYAEIEQCVRECITEFPFVMARNEKNLGSNLTFEQLTREAEGEYFAYCDQDDVWLPEKLGVLEHYFEADLATQLVYSDLAVIDKNGTRLANSIQELRPRTRYLQGMGLSEQYFFRNSAAGCCMLTRAETAKKAVPFPRRTVCDQWLAIVASLSGNIVWEKQPLVEYRQHNHNQTGILHGIIDKSSYWKQKIEPLQERLAAYQKLTIPSKELCAFVYARLEGDVGTIFRYRKFSPHEAIFEMIMHFCPDWLVKKCLRRFT